MADQGNAGRWVPAYIGLGSNLGDRRAFLAQGIQGLTDRSGIEVERVSTIYETDPVGPQPQGPYLNAVARIRTVLAARELLEALLGIERVAGRERDPDGPAWVARTLDLDILLYGDECIEEPGLVVPHPRLHERAFVLEPLLELAPNLIHPRLAESIASFGRVRRDRDAVRPWTGMRPGEDFMSESGGEVVAGASCETAAEAIEGAASGVDREAGSSSSGASNERPEPGSRR